MILAISLMIAGCGKGGEKTASDPAPSAHPIEVTDATVNDNDTPEEEPSADAAITPAADEVSTDAAPESTVTDPADENDTAADTVDNSEEDTNDTEEKKASNPNAQPIVWLGDSLTQGSLGHDKDNLPGAPYETLKKLVDVPVEGYGMYFYPTHDIFWVYTDSDHFNQTIDPKKTYIFWVGSNDWAGDNIPNTETSGVIAEIDRFLNLEGTINNYIVIGTTARYELGPEMAKTINSSLAAKYKEHYLDILDVIGPNGYGPDKVHLTQEAYDAVAHAVYEKLISLGYI